MERGHATHSTAKFIVRVTKLRDILKFSVYFPSKLEVQVVKLLLPSLFISPCLNSVSPIDSQISSKTSLLPQLFLRCSHINIMTLNIIIS